ncbi:MAG TPA: hypothetical protein VHE34_11320 [Puia sp.]|uniref:LIC_10190 family membrane protein n=1 Tax=Puia sp. TaxID=2045100 RepID=UPI002C2FF265|nr:hypothetical protein [Puia sp.]HVU95808.1 hypothetical protein [Puia sp.]
MLLLLGDSLLLIFITLSLGLFTRKILARLFRTPLHTDLLELLLLGLLASSLYFNLLSFFLPVNQWTLVPPAILALFVNVQYRDQTHAIMQSIRRNLRFFFAPRHWPFTTLIGIVCLIYWILPNPSQDSTIYHIESILWYEKFKVVPGLANLNGRLGFNPACFLIESAYSFSALTGEALYPLNGVAALFFYAWLLVRMLRAGRTVRGLLYCGFIILVYRITLIYIPSTSPGVMQQVCMCYILIKLAENNLAGSMRAPDGLEEKMGRSAHTADVCPPWQTAKGGSSLADNAVPAIIILYAIIVKPAAFALLPALLYQFFNLPRTQRTPALIGRTALVGLLIFLPWMGRNYILSGYLAFPFSATGWFHPDWKVPADVVKMEINYINQIPKTEGDFSPIAIARSKTLFGWFPEWVRKSLSLRPMDMVFLFMALLSPFYWGIRIFLRKTRAPLLAPWVIVAIATLAWLQASPVFRFGSTYVYLCFMLPMFDAADTFFHPSPQKQAAVAGPARWFPALALVALTLTGVFYIRSGFTRGSTYPFTLADCWLKPLRSIDYNAKEKMDFPFRVLSNGTKMYLSDDNHHCINACLPCMEFNYGTVEMRGSRLDEGFRTTIDEVKLHYPQFLK